MYIIFFCKVKMFFVTGPLVGFGVNIKGFSPSFITGKSEAKMMKEKGKKKTHTKEWHSVH